MNTGYRKICDFDLIGDYLLDADLFSDAADSLSGVGTGFMGAAAHGTNTLASQEKIGNSNEKGREVIFV